MAAEAAGGPRFGARTVRPGGGPNRTEPNRTVPEPAGAERSGAEDEAAVRLREERHGSGMYEDRSKSKEGSS